MDDFEIGDLVSVRHGAMMKMHDHKDDIAEVVGVHEFPGQGKRVRVRWPNEEPEFSWSDAGLFEKASVDEFLKTLPYFVAGALLEFAENQPIATVTGLEGPLPKGFTSGFVIDDGLREREFVVSASSGNLSLCARVVGTLVPKGKFRMTDREALAKTAVNYFYKFYDT